MSVLENDPENRYDFDQHTGQLNIATIPNPDKMNFY